MKARSDTLLLPFLMQSGFDVTHLGEIGQVASQAHTL